uniref:Ribulose bisphosphate carboxylase small subunit domain-containing protein n=1 Tax=Cannabis sativa TaxID=3483 RepID=A0A803Q9H2_CANSA
MKYRIGQKASELLQSWSRQEILQILCVEMGKERKYTGLTKLKIIEHLLKIVSEKKSGGSEGVTTDLDSQASPMSGQRAARGKTEQPSRLATAAASVSTNNGIIDLTSNGIVNRLSSGPEVQFASAVELLDSMNSNVTSDPLPNPIKQGFNEEAIIILFTRPSPNDSDQQKICSVYINLGSENCEVWGIVLMCYVTSSVISTYSKFGSMELACRFDQSVDTSCANGFWRYMKNNCFSMEAIELFLGAFLKKWVHLFIDKIGIEYELELSTALIDFYTKMWACIQENSKMPGYYDGRYWTMWKLPMFGCNDSSQVLSRNFTTAKKHFPTAIYAV